MASMVENFLALQGNAPSTPATESKNARVPTEEGITTSEYSIREVSFAENTADATISVISNNSRVNHYAVLNIPSCLRPRQNNNKNRAVSFHQKLSAAPPTFFPADTIWPYTRTDIESIDSDSITTPSDNMDTGNEEMIQPYATDEFIYARSTHLPSTFTSAQLSSTSKDKSLCTITDSGATHNMNPHRDMFDTIHPLHDKFGKSAQVTLGDGTTTRPVLGWGYARYIMLNGIPVRKYIRDNYSTTTGSIINDTAYSLF